ncbi:Arc/MetJ-type ribon-helix-helix transcriptional regulator [Methanohalophilus levihalophilus]|uniref:hypothetical protein n=1 Tax=Methanohalophilus levihalophilus TaxID=1431282 RepID=UPI001AE3318E|nr:hypothetical protein [Methanohalophilus levihalophilus]MBP2029732.1 Arc/MetJ-type ribon-helix-helix transcriptional regulator [Methanohalophilus levihalophilus]
MKTHGKIKTSISLSTHLYDSAKEMVDSNRFSSISDLVSTALTDFLARLEERELSEKDQSNMKFKELLEAYSKTDEGHKFLEELARYEKKR